MSNLNLEFHDFTSEEDIEQGVDMLCLVTSWEEPPYFAIMQRKVWGMVFSLDCSTPEERTKILKYAYLPRTKWGEWEDGQKAYDDYVLSVQTENK